MIVLVTGGREYGTPRYKPGMSTLEELFAKKRAEREVKTLNGVLDRLHAAMPIELIIHGRAFGADMRASHWAQANNVPQKGYQAEWGKYKNRAGIIRNELMFDANKDIIDLVLAFPGGDGTAHMTNFAETASKLGVWDGFLWQIK